jgi:prepilin-type processing-associated H-X9-DG protein
VFRVFRCPSDKGATAGRWASERKPSLFDTFGCSYFYNSGGNSNGDLGLHGKRIGQIRSPSKVIVANDYAFGMYGWIIEAPGPKDRPFQYALWHHDKAPCWGNVVFVDGHIDYRMATYNKPDYQNGQDWTFVFDGPR